MGPRKYSNPVHKDKFDMYELQDDMLEQSHRIRLLEQVELAGLMAGAQDLSQHELEYLNDSMSQSQLI